MQATFRPSIKQDKAWQYLTDNDTVFVGYGGAAFGGKSYLGSWWVTMMCLQYPEVAYGIGRKELTTLKKTTLLTLFKVFDEIGLKPDKEYKYNQQLNVITFANGSQIFLIDTAYKPSDPLYAGLGGYELTGCWIDESAETSYTAIEILFTRCGRKNNGKYGLGTKFLETFNPDKGHVYSRYYKPFKKGEEAKSTKFIQALPKDNPSPEVETYISNILATGSQITKERLIFGNFEYDDDPTTLMRFDAIQDLFTNTVDRDEKRYIVADIARYGGDRSVIAVWYGNECIELIIKEKRGVDQIAQDIRETAVKHQIPFSNIIADEDGIGGGVVDILRGIKGFMAQSTPFPNLATGNPDNFANLKAQCAYKLADLVNNHKIAIRNISPENKELLIQELEQIKTKDADKDGKLKIMPKDEVKERIGRSPDIADTFIMRMYFEYMKPRTNNPESRSISILAHGFKDNSDKNSTYY